jgi:hypothetical protein
VLTSVSGFHKRRSDHAGEVSGNPTHDVRRHVIEKKGKEGTLEKEVKARINSVKWNRDRMKQASKEGKENEIKVERGKLYGPGYYFYQLFALTEHSSHS